MPVKIMPRRPYPFGDSPYVEGDRDYVLNNIGACVKYLDARCRFQRTNTTMAKRKAKTTRRKMASRRTVKRTAKRRPVARRKAKTIRRSVRRASRPRTNVQRARAGYAYIVKLGDDYLTADGNYVYGQRYARRFTTRPTGSSLVRVTGDDRRPRVVSLHLAR